MAKRQHVDSVGEGSGAKQSEPPAKKCLLCEQCDYKTDRKYNMDRHVLTNHMREEITQVECEYPGCSRSFRFESDRVVHNRDFHKENPAIYECPYCEYVSNRKGNLTTHTQKCKQHNDFKLKTMAWLTAIENRTNALPPPNRNDLAAINQQIADVKQLINEHGAYKSTIKKINDAIIRTECSNGYVAIGVQLAEQQTNLENGRDKLIELQKYTNSLASHLDEMHNQLPKEKEIVNKDDAQKCIQESQKCLDNMSNWPRSILLNTRNDLKRSEPPIESGANPNEVARQWTDISEQCKANINRSQLLTDFWDTYANLIQWLTAKDRIITILDPFQPHIVDILLEEFHVQRTHLNHLHTVGQAVIHQQKSTSTKEIATKLEDVQKKWDNLVSQLNGRGRNHHSSGSGIAVWEALQSISIDVLNIGAEIDNLMKPAAEIDLITKQLNEAKNVIAKLEQARLSVSTEQFNGMDAQKNTLKTTIESVTVRINEQVKFLLEALQKLEGLTKFLRGAEKRLVEMTANVSNLNIKTITEAFNEFDQFKREINQKNIEYQLIAGSLTVQYEALLNGMTAYEKRLAMKKAMINVYQHMVATKKTKIPETDAYVTETITILDDLIGFVFDTNILLRYLPPLKNLVASILESRK